MIRTAAIRATLLALLFAEALSVWRGENPSLRGNHARLQSRAESHAERNGRKLANMSPTRSFEQILLKRKPSAYGTCKMTPSAKKVSKHFVENMDFFKAQGQRAGIITYKCHNGSTVLDGKCSCPDEHMLLYNFQGGQVQQSCCPLEPETDISNLQCSGCALYSDGGCARCLGGFTKMGSECVYCKNEVSFADKDGNTCADYATNLWCADGAPSVGFETKAALKYRHLSADESCCVCGGGRHKGTPFEYPIERLNDLGLAGTSFKAIPYPRTSNHYIVGEDCKLEEFGLTINQGTGVIEGVPTSAEPFEINCNIKARAKQAGNVESSLNPRARESSTKLKISTKAFGYKPSDEKVATARATSALTFDEFHLNRFYTVEWAPTISATNPKFSVTCAPQLIIKIDSASGSISLGNITNEQYLNFFDANTASGRFTSDPVQTPSGHEKVMRSNCHVSATDDSGTKHYLDVKVFAYPPFPSGDITYYPSHAVKVTVGQPVIEPMELVVVSPDKTTQKAIPGLYSVDLDCVTDIGKEVVYEMGTGHVSIDGLPIVTIHPVTGKLYGSSHIGLRRYMPASDTRSHFTVGCDVYAAVPTAALDNQERIYKSDKKLVIQVDSDQCWVDGTAYTTPEGWTPSVKSNNPVTVDSAAACKSRCVSSISCAGYNFSPLTGKCFELVITPPDIPRESWSALKEGDAKIKVDNCQLHQTCVEVNVVGKRYLSGNYCPLLSQMESNPHPVYEMPGSYKEDTFYLMKYDKKTEAHQPMPDGCTPTNTAWVFRRASGAGADVVDVEKNYIEMHGQIEGCIFTDILDAPAVLSSLLEVSSKSPIKARFRVNSSSSAESEPASFTIARSAKGERIESRMSSILSRRGLEEANPRVVSTGEGSVYNSSDRGGVFADALQSKSHSHSPHVHTPYPTPNPTRYPTRFPTPTPTRFPTKYPTNYPTKYPTYYPTPSPMTKTPTSSPTTKSPTTSPITKSPTRNPTTKSPTNSPTTLTPTTVAPSVSVAIREVYDQVPLKLTHGLILGESEYRAIDISPIGKKCFSPLYKEDEDKQKSSTEDDAANEEEVSELEKQQETGMLVGNTQPNKERIFKFDDPNTVSVDDYYLHPCQCAFEEWGHYDPVTKLAHEAASIGAMDKGMKYNRYVPDGIKLWMGPFVCDQNLLIESVFEASDCAVRCNDKSDCKFFVDGEGSGGRFCYLYSGCNLLMRIDTDFVLTGYAMHKPTSATDLLCHIADPEICWQSTRRRAYLTQKDHAYGTCQYQTLLEQCDFMMLMGDGAIEFCSPCMYMTVSSQDEGKRKMPPKFPHGATLDVSCSDNYNLVSSRPNSEAIVDTSITCIDGEWRDASGQIGLIGLQCSACIQLYDKKSKATELISAGQEELLFIDTRTIGLYFIGHSYNPLWIEVENGKAIQTNAAPKLGSFTWRVTLDGSIALQLSDPISGKCLAIRDYPIATQGILDVLRLSRCQVSVSLLETSEMKSLAEETVESNNSILPPHPPSTAKIVSKKPVEHLESMEKSEGLQSTLRTKTNSPTREPTEYPTPAPTKYPTPVPTKYPTGQDKVLMLLKDAFQRVSKQRQFNEATAYNSGWKCGTTSNKVGFLTKISSNARCLRRYRTPVTSTVSANLESGQHSLSLQCPQGEAMHSLSRISSLHTAQCAPVPALGQCMVYRLTIQSSAFNPLPTTASSPTPVECGGGEVVTGWEADGSSSGNGYNVRINVKCCTMPFYGGYTLSSDSLTSFESYEGQFCPYAYDDVFRPMFKQTYAFGNYLITSPPNLVEAPDQPQPKLEIIKAIASQSPRTLSSSSSKPVFRATPSGTLGTSPVGLGKSSKNKAVTATRSALSSGLTAVAPGLLQTNPKKASFKEFNQVLQSKSHVHTPAPTKNPTPHPTRFPTPSPTKFPTPSPTSFPTPFPKPGQISAVGGSLAYNKDTDKWCLDVGGKEMCTTPTGKTVHPNNVAWLSDITKGTQFTTTLFDDMVGLGLSGGTSVSRDEKTNPPKPTLVEFKTSDPAYSEGCLKMSQNKFSEAAQIFDENDPCGYVASSKWTEEGSEEGPGINYGQLVACAERETDRSIISADVALGTSNFENIKDIFWQGLKLICPNIPEPENGGGGGLAGPFFGVSFKSTDLCDASLDTIHGTFMSLYNLAKNSGEHNLAIEDSEDCSYAVLSIQRILCDLHCVSDAVKAGTKAVIHNIKGASKNILDNSDMLMDYYATVIMNKVSSEVAKVKEVSFITEGAKKNETVTEYIARFKADLNKYLLPKEILNIPEGQVDRKAADVLLEAQQSAREIIEETHAQLKNANMEISNESHEATIMISRALARLDLVLAAAHNQALDQQMLRMQGKAPYSGSEVLKKDILRAVVAFNTSNAVNRVIHHAQYLNAKTLKTRGETLVETARVVREHEHLFDAKIGALANKLDLLIHEVRDIKSDMETSDLDESLTHLVSNSIKMHDLVDRYVGSANAFFETSHHTMMEVHDYLECHENNPSFIRKASRDITTKAGAAQSTLREAFPQALESLRSTINDVEANDVLNRCVKSAIGGQFVPLGAAMDKEAAHWVSAEGVKEVIGLTYAQIDTLPLDVSKQILSMFSLGRFLHYRMQHDDGKPPSPTHTQSLLSAFGSFKGLQKTLVNDLSNATRVSKTIERKIDVYLVDSHLAPATCRQLAFDLYAEPSAQTLVVLAKKGDMMVISQPYAKLLAYRGDFQVPLSSSTDFDSFPTKFPSGILRSAYVCQSDGTQHKTHKLTRVTESKHDIFSVCNMERCTGLKDVIHFASWKVVKDAIDAAVKGSQFLGLVDSNERS